jgi:hypothetical protein
LRNACHSFASALVCDSRRRLALALNLSISPPGRSLHLSPAGRGRIAQAIRVRALSTHPDLGVLYPSPQTGSATNLELHLRLPLTRPLRGRPLPNGERYSTANAAL